MKLDAFNIFLILLGLLVVITISMNWFLKSEKEPFVNFQNNPQAGTQVYIPQYSADATRKLIYLYDNLYIDPVNGGIIEVDGPICQEASVLAKTCNDDGTFINQIIGATRDGQQITAVTTQYNTDGSVKPTSSTYSLLNSLASEYKAFIYNTQNDSTNKYQLVYISMGKETYAHLIDLSANTTKGTLLRSIHLNSSGFVDSQTLSATLAEFSANVPTMAAPASLESNADLANAFTLAKDDNNKIIYDVSNGRIIIKKDTVDTVYDRNGEPSPSGGWTSLDTIKTSVFNNIPGISVIVSAYKFDTIITILKQSQTKYEHVKTYRFNKSGVVDRDTAPTDGPTPAPSGATTMPQAGTPFDQTSTSSGTSGEKNSNVCGDDLSCKWYWYFNTIAQKNSNGDTYFSDDYFLKTEAVPPVCPECPQCPASGACSNCGGTGGGGCANSTTSPVATTKASGPLPPGGVRDNSGNTYVPYKDASGNTRYVLYTASNTGAGAGAGAGGQKNLTIVDKDGQFVSTSDPDTIGGGLALSSFSLGQLGTAGFNSVGGVANNVIDSAEGAFGSVTNLAGGVVGTAADLAKGAGSGAVGLVKDLGSGIANLGQGPMSIQQQQQQQVGGGVAPGIVPGGMGPSGFAPVSAKTFGNMPGSQTPVDNYSAYGALQSKGGNYMPVTADFSAFRK